MRSGLQRLRQWRELGEDPPAAGMQPPPLRIQAEPQPDPELTGLKAWVTTTYLAYRSYFRIIFVMALVALAMGSVAMVFGVWGWTARGGKTNVNVTLVNAGNAGEGVYDSNPAPGTYDFRNIAPASSKETVTLDAGHKNVLLDVRPDQLGAICIATTPNLNGGQCVTIGSNMTIGMDQALAITQISVADTTFLGNFTTCLRPLQASCYDISNQGCSMPLQQSCLPPNPTFDTLMVTNLNVVNSSTFPANVNLNTVTVATTLQLGTGATMTCAANGSIASGCIDLDGQSCANPLQATCFPSSLTLSSLTVTTINGQSGIILYNGSDATLGIVIVQDSLTLDGPLTCAANASVAAGCITASSLNGQSCSAPFDPTCIPTNLNLGAITVTSINGQPGTPIYNGTNAALGTVFVSSVLDLQPNATLVCEAGASVSPGCLTPASLNGQSCSAPFDPSCIPANLAFGAITVTSLNGQAGTPIYNGTNANLGSVIINGNSLLNTGVQLSCAANASVAQGCININGIGCSSPIQQSCLPTNAVFSQLTVNNLLVLNHTTSSDVLHNGSAAVLDYLQMVGPIVLNGTSAGLTCLPGSQGVSQACISIAGITCTSPVSQSCLPTSPTFGGTVTANVFNAVTSISTPFLQATSQTVGTLTVDTLATLNAPLQCGANGSVSQGCISISGIGCTSPVQQSCLPSSPTFGGTVTANTFSAVSGVTTPSLSSTAATVGSLTVNTLATLEAPLQCAANGSIAQGCISISGIGCTSPVQQSCLPSSPTFGGTVTANTFSAVSGVTTPSLSSTAATVGSLTVNTLATLQAPLQCAANGSVAQGCISISGIGCSSPVQQSCLPSSPTFAGTVTASTLQATTSVTSPSALFNAATIGSLTVDTQAIVNAPLTCGANGSVAQGCFNINNIACSTPVQASCLPQDQTLTNVTIANLIVTGAAVLPGYQPNVNGTTISLNGLLANSIHLNTGGSMTCAANATVAQGCLNLGGYVCPNGSPLTDSCFPAAMSFTNLTSTNTLAVNQVQCLGGHLTSQCVQTPYASMGFGTPSPLNFAVANSSASDLFGAASSNGFDMGGMYAFPVATTVTSVLANVVIGSAWTSGSVNFQLFYTSAGAAFATSTNLSNATAVAGAQTVNGRTSFATVLTLAGTLTVAANTPFFARIQLSAVICSDLRFSIVVNALTQ